MTIARLNERTLLALGMDRVTVKALQHLLDQAGNEIGATTLPSVALQVGQVPSIITAVQSLDSRLDSAEIQTAKVPQLVIDLDLAEIQTAQVPALVAKTNYLDFRATLIADALANNTASDVSILSLPISVALAAGAQISGRVIGLTSNSSTPGTLNIWLSANGTKVFTHSFVTPATPGTNKGFAADFTITMRSATLAQIGGVLSLAFNTPTVLPSANTATTTFAATPALALGMNWTAAAVGNTATAKLAYLAVERL